MSRRAAVVDAFGGARTVVALHAHPDDESLLTGGTLAALAAAGCRVVLVTATDGEAGLTGDDAGALGHRRGDELLAAAGELGVHRVVRLGHRDSGVHGEAGGPTATDRFCDADVAAVAREVVAVLREERADVLVGYDPAGGYGHPDHRQVHRVARAAARGAGTPRLLEVTVDRRPLRPFLALIGLLRPVLPVPDLPGAEHGGWTRSSDIDLRLDVRDHVPAKQRALRAHASQATGGIRTVAVLAALPTWLARRVLGTEWFLEVPDPDRT